MKLLSILSVIAAPFLASVGFGQAAGYTRVNTLPFSVANDSSNKIQSTIYAYGTRNAVTQIPFDVDVGATRVWKVKTLGLQEQSSPYGSLIQGIITSGVPIGACTGRTTVIGTHTRHETSILDPRDGIPNFGNYIGYGTATPATWTYNLNTNDYITSTINVVNPSGSQIGFLTTEITNSPVAGKIINASTRGWVNGTANSISYEIFVEGPGTMRVCVRVLGPTVEALGGMPPGTAIVNPALRVRENGNKIPQFVFDDWGTSPLPAGVAGAARADAYGYAPPNAYEPALVMEMSAGWWVVEATDLTGSSGIALVEFFAF